MILSIILNNIWWEIYDYWSNHSREKREYNWEMTLSLKEYNWEMILSEDHLHWIKNNHTS